jgi:hypothetical protein
MTPAGMRIDRLRVRDTPRDATVLRLRLGRCLEGLAPVGIPPCAVLLIRRLDDPLPRGLDLTGYPPRGRRAWEGALYQRMLGLYQGAARPLAGPVPAGALAVVFSDEAEMLACLALDILHGDAHRLWWWRSLLRHPGQSDLAILVDLLLERTVHVPAMLSNLADRSQATALIAALDSPAAVALLHALCRAHGLPNPVAVPDVPGGIRRPGDRAPRSAEDPGAVPAQAHRFRGAPSQSRGPGLQPVPTWLDWLPGLPEVAEHLSSAHLVLLILGIGLDRTPTQAHRPDFSARLLQWIGETRRDSADPSDPGRNRPSPGPLVGENGLESAGDPQGTIDPRSLAGTDAPGMITPRTGHLAWVEPLPATGATMSAVGRIAEAAREPRPSEAGGTGALAPRTAPDAETDPHRRVPAREVPQERPRDAPASRRMMQPGTGSPTQAEPPPSTEPSTCAEASRQIGAAVEAGLVAQEDNAPDAPESAVTGKRSDLAEGRDTRLGGAFYLLNLMAGLDLPNCYEEDWRLATDLGSWGLLELLCRSLLNRGDAAALADPLWSLLAALDGRESGTFPGARLRDPGRFRLPRQWPLTGADALGWTTDRGSLWLWVEQGPLLAEVPPPADLVCEPVAMALARDYLPGVPLRPCAAGEIPLAGLDGRLTADLAPGPRRWLERTLPYLHFRLRLALGADTRHEDLGERLLCYAARVYLSSAHLDVVLRLSDVSVALRRAGLDRDPGWLPELGRVVLFHFE